MPPGTNHGVTAAVAVAGLAGYAAAVSRWRSGAADPKEAALVEPGGPARGVPTPAKASGTAVGARFNLRSAARCVRAPSKRERTLNPRVPINCGEDAFFLASPTEASATVGVADGVGGWSGVGVDSALFAWDLMHRCKDIAESCGGASSSSPSSDGSSSSSTAPPPATPPELRQGEGLGDCPRSVLIEGYFQLRQLGTPLGSSTACLASLDRRSGDLKVANLGDSGALIIRGTSGECVLESHAQTHRFNCPFQLCARGGGDTPVAADVYTIPMRPGDLVVLATDGFLDNVSATMATRTTAAIREEAPERIAETLVALAQAQAESPTEDTPFSLEARKHGYKHWGGKPDDITVVVARVEPVS